MAKNLISGPILARLVQIWVAWAREVHLLANQLHNFPVCVPPSLGMCIYSVLIRHLCILNIFQIILKCISRCQDVLKSFDCETLDSCSSLNFQVAILTPHFSKHYPRNDNYLSSISKLPVRLLNRKLVTLLRLRSVFDITNICFCVVFITFHLIALSKFLSKKSLLTVKFCSKMSGSFSV